MRSDELITPFFARYVRDRKMTIDEVPKMGKDNIYPLREKVKELLIEWGYPELTIEKDQEE